MHIDQNLIPIFAIGVGLIIGVTSILAKTISNTRLKIEQIRADAMVRAEEVRMRNQLELEKMMQQDKKTDTENNGRFDGDNQRYDEDGSRQRSRVRE